MRRCLQLQSAAYAYNTTKLTLFFFIEETERTSVINIGHPLPLVSETGPSNINMPTPLDRATGQRVSDLGIPWHFLLVVGIMVVETEAY
jgi:hypothetical protein